MKQNLDSLVLKVNSLREEAREVEALRPELDTERLLLARNMDNHESMRLDIQEMESKRFDEAAVTGIFDLFDKLKDKILRIEVGGRRFLKIFLTHSSFDRTPPRLRPSRPSPSKTGEKCGTLRGSLFNAEVYHNGNLTNETVRVYGHEKEEPSPERPVGTKHPLELVYCK